MAKWTPAQIRNVAIVGHGHDGKTSLAEAMLWAGKSIERKGSADAGTTTLDFDPEEIKRKMTISAAIAPVLWHEHKINLIDCPGFLDFAGEVVGGLAAADLALIAVTAQHGVAVGTEKAWEQAVAAGLPRAFVITKMDKENADFKRVLADLRAHFQPRPVALQVPIGQEGGFKGLVDLLSGKAYVDAGAGDGSAREEPLPAELEAQVAELRPQMVEAAAEGDDALVERFLADEALTDEEIVRGLREGILAGSLVPVFVTSALKGTGVPQLLDALVNLAPSPADRPPRKVEGRGGQEVELSADPSGPLCAFVFKTVADPFVGKLSYVRVLSGTLRGEGHVWNASRGQDERVGAVAQPKGKTLTPVPEGLVAGDIGAMAKLAGTVTGDSLGTKENPLKAPTLTYPEPVYVAAFEPKNKNEEEKVFSSLAKLAEEDRTMALERDPVTKEQLIRGLGDQHVEVLLGRMKAKYAVEATLRTPKVPYKETIRKPARAQGRHKKQTGGHGQFGDCTIEVEPLPRGGGFEFVDKIFGGSIPRQFIPAVEKGLLEGLERGNLAGVPVVDVKVTLVDGSYHTVDSSELSFKLAARMAWRQAQDTAGAYLLEPIMDVEVLIPDRYLGDVISDLNSKRGHVVGMETSGPGRQSVRARAPQSEMFQFAADLRSITQGRGSFSMRFDHYAEVPANVAQPVIEAHARERSGKEEE